jgi:nicotinamide mononucleotide transporter
MSVEWIAVLFALGYVLLAVRQHAWCWLLAAASSALYIWVFARGALYMQAVLQVFYIVMAVYGWYAWRRRSGPADEPVLAVHRWTTGQHLGALAIVIVATLGNGYWLAENSDAVAPYVDSLVTWGSVVATWMMARKVLENWLYWVLFDALAALLYWQQGLQATALLFVLYVGIAVHGYLTWRRSAGA